MKLYLLKWASFLSILFLAVPFMQAQPRKYPANYTSSTTPVGPIVVAYVSAGSDIMPDGIVIFLLTQK